MRERFERLSSDDERPRPDNEGRRAPDALRQLRPHVVEERVAHAGELAQVPVVGEHDAGSDEMERVEVRVGDDRVARASSGRAQDAKKPETRQRRIAKVVDQVRP